jgi:hypothetical protein
MNGRSGNVLPPPADECSNSSISMAKPVVKSLSNVRLHARLLLAWTVG